MSERGVSVKALPASAGGRPVALAAAGALAFAGVVLGGLAFVSTLGQTAALPLAAPFAASAEARLRAGTARADLDAAEAATEHEIALAPRSVDAQLRLAAIEVARDGGLTVKALDALARSYALAPVDPDLWRVRDRLALEHWTELDAPVRAHVRDELSTLARGPQAAAVRAMAAEVQNPTGRFAAALSLDYVPTGS
jgi:hypothetical protein